MNWQEVCEDPVLRNLPYKIELNEWGQIVMSPASNRHGVIQSLLVQVLTQAQTGGLAIAECSIQTAEGVKVADIAWASDSFMQRYGLATPYPKSPEICIEIVSPSNSARELVNKRGLYFAKGAQEVWLCDEQGGLTFYDCVGQIEASHLFPSVIRIQTTYLH
jgi:Uma2 family endonuclease